MVVLPNAQVPGGPMVNAMAPAQPGVKAGGSYFPGTTQSPFEVQAGVAAPEYYSLLDAGGNLKAPFSMDPSRSEAFSKMQAAAGSTDLSPWAQLQKQSLDEQTATARDNANKQSLGATSQAMQQLMTTGGGLGSSARAMLAAQGAKNNIMSNQDIERNKVAQDIDIQQQDAQNKAQMLGQVANTETGALAANAQTGIGDIGNANQFAANRYGQQMQAWGAAKTAEAQRAAAQGGKK